MCRNLSARVSQRKPFVTLLLSLKQAFRSPFAAISASSSAVIVTVSFSGWDSWCAFRLAMLPRMSPAGMLMPVMRSKMLATASDAAR